MQNSALFAALGLASFFFSLQVSEPVLQPTDVVLGAFYRVRNYLMFCVAHGFYFEGLVIMPGRRQSSCQNEIPRVWHEGLVSQAETSRHAYFLRPHFLGLDVGNLSPKPSL
jgi:hypothetical protein